MRPRLVISFEMSVHSYVLGMACGRSDGYGSALFWLWINWRAKHFRLFGTKQWRRELQDFKQRRRAA